MRSSGQTKLAHHRVARGISQEDLAEAVGINRKTYRALEYGEDPNPGLRVLGNAAVLLGVEVEDLIEDRFRAWEQFRKGPPRPPQHHPFTK